LFLDRPLCTFVEPKMSASVLAALVITASAWAQEAGPGPGSEAGDLLPPAAEASDKQSPDDVARRASRRRTLLTLHQTFGLVTLAGLAATVVVGQFNYQALYGGGTPTRRFDVPHNLLALGTTVAFLTTGLLALFAPEPYAKRGGRFDTVSTHKLSMLVATVLMAAEFAVGVLFGEGIGHIDPQALAVTHMVLGYGALAAMTVGSVALLF
jgi:hypothetical protein